MVVFSATTTVMVTIIAISWGRLDHLSFIAIKNW